MERKLTAIFSTESVSPKQVARSPVEEQSQPRRWPVAALAVVAVRVVSAIVLVLRNVSPRLAPPVETESTEDNIALPLPDKPSIAALPFSNMSGDPEQEYFGDGLTEDLITDLSKISELFVIAPFPLPPRPLDGLMRLSIAAVPVPLQQRCGEPAW